MGEDRTERLGLRTLEDISTLILHSHDLQETLDNVVNLVAKRMGTDVCSIYLLEEDGNTLTLKATKGLSRSSVGKITMKTSEGLTGMALARKAVVNIEDAPSHPRYKYFPETKEERFHSFLGVPFFERNAPVGVIVIQNKAPRAFTSAEISTLSTIAYQISSIVINAKLLDSVSRKEEERAFFQKELERMKAAGVIRQEPVPGARKKGKVALTMVGTPSSSGFCWGRIYMVSRTSRNGTRLEKILSVEEERQRFLLAQEKVKIHTLYMEKRVAQTLSAEDAAIFHTHLMILEDRGFSGKVLELIENDTGAVRAVREVVDHYVQAFSTMEDPYLRQRSADMEDIGRRLIDALDGSDRSRSRLREKRILVADEILPSDMATLDHDKVLGIITEKGDINSHASIMAKSLGIPAVLGVQGLLKKVGLRDELIIDGTSGHIYINPDELVKAEYVRLQRDFGLKRRELDELREIPAITADGFRVYLHANIGLLSDVRVALANGAEGVGLYRTEFPYMTRKCFPDRHEQYRLYRRILEGFGALPVNIRTLDIGGDKGLPYFTYPKEDNPFMGWRSIRVSLERKDIFVEQLAAILMASPYGKASIMFPMISGVDEIRKVKEIIAEVKEELRLERQPYNPELRFGIMIELPAAVQTAGMLAQEVDYFSIGTNDLIQYTLAADRNNPMVRKYYEPFHPAVLHSIKHVAEIAIRAGKPISVCGEMAADPLSAIILLGLGINNFSMSAPAIPVIKQLILSITKDRAAKIAEDVISLASCDEIKSYMAEIGTELGL